MGADGRAVRLWGGTAVKTPNFTDKKRYPRGYTTAAATNIEETFKRERIRLERQRYMDNSEFSELVRTARALDGLRVD